jgi:hypothetical protein
VGQLSGLAGGHEPDAELPRERTAEDEAARLCRDDQIDVQWPCVCGQLLDRGIERRRVEQQRRYVLEDDPRLGKAGDVADVVTQLQARCSG